MRHRYASLLFLASAIVAGCDLVEPAERETTIYGFWEGVSTGVEDYTAITPTERVSYVSAGDCFSARSYPVTSATDTYVETVDPETGRRQAAELDSTDTDRMTLTVGSFVGGVRFEHERVNGDVRSQREVERLVCED